MMRKQGSIIDGKEWFARPSLALALLTGLFGQFESAKAQQAAPDLPTEPILRIEAGQHSAPIRRVDTDAANRFAVTASRDKTARVWSLPEGRLLRVLRLPIDNDNIGQARAVRFRPTAALSRSVARPGSPITTTFFCLNAHPAP
jgi:hypothetical protein